MDKITQIQLRRDTKANWENANPILALGEPGVEINANGIVIGFKLGDGINHWRDLEYQTGDFKDLADRITELETNVAGLNTQVGGIDSQLNNPSTGIVKQINDLDTTTEQQGTSISNNARDIGLVADNLLNETSRATNKENELGRAVSTEASAREHQDHLLDEKISAIAAKIPTEASASNQLADKEYVASAINNVSAYYITKNAQGDPFATKLELTNATIFYSGGEQRVPTRNDYCTVLADESHAIYTAEASNVYSNFDSVDDYLGYYIDNSGDMVLVTSDNKNNLSIIVGTTVPYTQTIPTTRYTYQNGWEFQYVLNDTAFTISQLNAINSGVTSADVAQIGSNTTAIGQLNVNKQAALSTDYSLQINNNQISLTGALPYITTEPVAANTNGIKIVVLDHEPIDRYDGYWYIITEAEPEPEPEPQEI